jgi:hypothetical protein
MAFPQDPRIVVDYLASLGAERAGRS